MVINSDTRVAVCCYEGDKHQVVELMPFYTHHECPVTILSPLDSQVFITAPGVDSAWGGKRCYIGWDGVERMKEHLRILLTYPENFFLIHDADSLCITPRLPEYLYEYPDTLWTAVIPNGVPAQQPGFAPDMPHLAFHPPWFMSRNTIRRLLAVGDKVLPNKYLPFIDYWMLEAAVLGGIDYKSFEHSMSVPTNSDVGSAKYALDMASVHGARFFHSVKTGAFAKKIAQAYGSRGPGQRA